MAGRLSYMEILEAIEKAAIYSTKYQVERIEELAKINEVVKEDWVPSEEAFVADMYYYLREILGEDKSKYLILETTPYVENKKIRTHIIPDLSYSYGNKTVVVEVKTPFHIKRNVGLDKDNIKGIQKDCESLKTLKKNKFKKTVHVIAFINTKGDFKSEEKEATEPSLKKEVKKACTCGSEIIVCLGLAKV